MYENELRVDQEPIKTRWILELHAVSKTMGDGHCFLYAVIDSRNKQHPCKQRLYLDDVRQLTVSLSRKLF